MSNEAQYPNKRLAIDEFRDIISKYILPIFGAVGDLIQCDVPTMNKELVEIVSAGDRYYAEFYPQISYRVKTKSPFHFKIEVYNKSLKNYATKILSELLKQTTYSCVPPYSIKRYYGKNSTLAASYLKSNLDHAFEIGMCLSLIQGPPAAEILHFIIERMLEWSTRTYEGKNVPFGIVVDFNAESANPEAADYIHFLGNESSAVFTDGMFTGILLDKFGKIITFIPGHLSESEEHTNKADNAEEKEKEVFVPYQYFEIGKACTDKRIGVIALANGEILLIKGQEIKFAKRGRKWVFFDSNTVTKKLRRTFLQSCNDERIIKKRIDAIYCSLLDVSFSHTGGCLALVNPDAEKKIDMVVKERMDLWSKIKDNSKIESETKEKINILRHLLCVRDVAPGASSGTELTIRSFFDVDRRLRKEILSLDGATVVSLNGDFFCAGSIVEVSGGSSGGGRTAAAENLARFGIGIKISEDGYIEAYTKPQNFPQCYCRRGEVETLFKFK